MIEQPLVHRVGHVLEDNAEILSGNRTRPYERADALAAVPVAGVVGPVCPAIAARGRSSRQDPCVQQQREAFDLVAEHPASRLHVWASSR